MNLKEVTMVRVFFTEGEHLLDKIMKFLHDEAKVKGVTVFRGVSGFGASGKVHTANLVYLSLDLPMVLEFFDVPEKVKPVMEQLSSLAGVGHVVCWSGQANLD